MHLNNSQIDEWRWYHKNNFIKLLGTFLLQKALFRKKKMTSEDKQMANSQIIHSLFRPALRSQKFEVTN